MGRRQERVGDLLLETLSDLVLREVKDPRVGAVTFTRADVSPDLRNATVHFCALGRSAEEAESALVGLRSASKFLQGKAARILHLRYAPEIRFEIDERFDRVERIERLLREGPSSDDE